MRIARQPKAGRLISRWGRIRYGNPDYIYVWGDGCSKSDAAEIGYWLHVRTNEDGRTLMQELAHRGYDTTTFRFTIDKKKSDANPI